MTAPSCGANLLGRLLDDLIELARLVTDLCETLQPPAAQRGAAGGEGIGLAIVKRLCGLLDASLEPQSDPGRGTTFRIVFPRGC